MRRRPAASLVLPVLVATALAPAPAATAAVGRDPLLGRQWHLGRDGTRAMRAWAVSRGGPITAAVIDSGVDVSHPDLVRNSWRNPGEVAGNGVDDDANGYVDDVRGWDWVDDDADPADENGHGTHVAGVLGARGGNRIGVSGVAQRVRIMPLRVLDAGNGGSMRDVAAALRYALTEGARVVNLSLNTPSPDPAVEAALEAADAAGVLVVVSAGNEHADLGLTPSFPACSSSPAVLAVAATDRSGGLAPFSNRGSCVDLAAPGEDIVSTRRGGGYESRSGTSMAAPQVAGAAVLLLAARPALGVPELRAALVGSTAAMPGAAPRSAAVPGRLDVPRGLRAALRAPGPRP